MRHASFFVAIISAFFSVAPFTYAAEPSSIAVEQYQHARKLIDDKKLDEAKKELTPLNDPGFILGDYAAYDLALIEFEQKFSAKALSIYENIEKEFPQSPLVKDINGKQLRIACEDPGSKICGKTLKRIGLEKLEPPSQVERKLIIAKRNETKGKDKEAYILYQEIYYNHPVTPAAEEARLSTIRLLKSDKTSKKRKYPYATYMQRMQRVKEFIKAYRYESAVADLRTMLKINYSDKRKADVLSKLGYALNKGRDKKGAKRVYKKLISKYHGSSNEIKAEYNIAVIDWNLNNNSAAVKRLRKLTGSSAKDKRKAKAYLVLGRIAESAGKFDTAISQYEKALDFGPDSELQYELRWRIGWVKYQRAEYSAAAKQFAKMIEKTPNKLRTGQLLYWRARAMEKAGNKKSAKSVFNSLLRSFPHTYYGSLAMEQNTRFTGTINISRKEDILAEEKKLSGLAKYHHDRYMALVKIGMFKEARLELDVLSKQAKKDPGNALWLGLKYKKAKAPQRSIRLQVNALGYRKRMDDFENEFWRALYPIDYWETIRKESTRLGIDPFITLSIIRQESAFNPEALSPANALGLMQLLPRLGKHMFKKIDMRAKIKRPFERSLLFDPEVNIKLGIAHLAELLSRYNGDFTLTAAAYNAGSKAVDIWVKKLGSKSTDEFVELIPYMETRGYVKRVTRNMALYRRIYLGGKQTPRKAASGSAIGKQEG